MKRLLFLLLLSTVFWAVGCQVAAHGPAQSIDVREFVRQTFIHGVPYEEASKYGSEVVPVLLAMLDDPREEVYWANIVATLGIIGDDQAFKPLISFLEKEFPGTLSYSHYVAKTSVLMSLGYLINKSGNQQALSYMQGGLNPAAWTERRLNWKSPFHDTAAQRDQQLVSTAVIGLALSGHPAARESLLAFQKELGAKPEFRELVAEAIRANEEIAREGLAGYYSKDRLTGTTLVLDPNVSRLGSIVKVQGSGYPVDTPVSIKYSVAGTDRIVTTLTPDASGNISGSFAVPLDSAIPSTNSVRAEYKTPAGAIVTTSGTHSVPNASITVSPTSGVPGTKVTVKGVGFKRFVVVDEIKVGNLNALPSPNPNTGDAGDFTVIITIPQTEVGVQTVSTRAGSTSPGVGGTTASASFIVTAAPVGAVPVAAAPAAGLAPLGANLVLVWGYDAPTQKFQLYDPASALLSDLTVLSRGQGYWINVKAAQKVILGSFEYDLKAGWNLKGWLG